MSGGDASGNTPAQGNGALSRKLPTTGFLSLPNELLVKIARDLAPNGGRKAGPLRLVCRRLGRVVAPVTWASIVLPTGAERLDEIGAELMNNDDITSKIVSVRFNNPVPYSRMIVKALKKLPSLRRLHLAGTSTKLALPHRWLRSDWNSLEEVKLDHVDLSYAREVTDWAPNAPTLAIVGCKLSEAVFTKIGDESHVRSAYHTRRLHLSIPGSVDSDTIINTVIIALHANRLAEEIELDCDVSVPGIYMDAANDRFLRATTLTLSGATRLFMAAPPNDLACPTIVKLLNWVGRGPLVTLSLPVFHPFFAHDALAALVLPRVQTLVFDVDPNSLTSTDLLSLDKYTHLIRFLKLASLPSLSTLHLRGWIDTTGVNKLATINAESLPEEAPLVFSLLSSLRKTNVVELRVENSRGHVNSDLQYIFSREGSVYYDIT